MVARRPLFSMRTLIAIVVAGTLVFGLSVYLGVNFAADRAVRVDAEAKGRQWAEYFIETMPRLEQVMTTGTLDEQQQAILTSAEKVGDVFRFKLFDAQGGLVLVSDEVVFNAEPTAQREHSDKAAGVLATGVSNISVNDGTGKQNRPPLYAEAYVPIVEPNGDVSGVVEVYIDQTATAELFRTTFAVLAIGLAVVAALAFGLPMLAYLLRSRQASEATMRADFLAHHDPMTGVLNRSSAVERLEALLADRRHNLAIAYFDVDDFKSVNDTFGHESGDEFLKHVARAIRSQCTELDVAGRPGGDEFTLVLVDRTPEEVVTAVEAILAAIREPVTIRGRTILGRASAGLYIVEDPADGLAEVMHKTDVALYQSKIDGGNIYRHFSNELEARMQARRDIEQRIREAMAGDLFELHYQPLLAAGDKRCAGFEALLRLPDGAGGFIPPVAFIPVAESIGLINQIGQWVLEQATRAAAGWSGDLFVSVNLSARQFTDGHLVGHVKRALAESGLSPGRLELEITESMLIENTESVAAQLRELRALGVSVAMDDFGTGYSSLGYLWQFGFDKLKIDRTFVTALEKHDRQARDILDTIITLGHKLDMTVTAEGIETEHQASVLESLACDYFQGFLYGRPVPLAEVAPFLLRNIADEAAEKRRPARQRA